MITSLIESRPDPMKNLLPFTLLIILFCCGSAWGQTKEENRIEANQQVKSPDSLSADPDHHEFPATFRGYSNAAEKKATPEMVHKPGGAYTADRNDDSALESYRKLLSISPNDANAHYSIGVILERKGDLDKAVNEFERCTALDKDNWDARRRLAEIYSIKGELEKTIAEYQQILMRSHDNPAIYFKLAKAYQRSGKNDEARQAFEMAIKLEPKNLEPRRELIKLEIRAKNLPKAEKLCREVLAANRDDKQERKRLIGILGREKKYHELELFLADESARYPTDSTIFYQLGIVRDYLKEFRGAIQAYTKSISIKPAAQTYNALARAYLSVSEPKKAKDALLEANKLDPNKKDVKELIEMIDESFDRSNTGNSGKGAGKKNRP